MKKFYFVLPLFASISFIAVLSSSCSDKDEEGNAGINPNTVTPEESIAVSAEQEGVVMTYCLLNSNGKPTTTFSEGEEITFDLKIENTTENTIYLPDGPAFLGYNTFRIFTREGEDCGISWSYPEHWTKEMKLLLPSNPKHYQCPWYSDESIKATYPFYFQPTAKRLTKGSYYTEAHCYFKNGTELTELCCIFNFNIENL